VAERLGRHLLLAGELEEALTPLAEGTQNLLDLGEYRRAEVLMAERTSCMDELDLAVQHPFRVELLIQRSMLQRAHGHYDEALRFAQEAEDAARGAGLLEQESHAARERGRALSNLGDRDAAWDAIEHSAELAQQSGNPRLIAGCRWNMGDILLGRGDLELAAACFAQARADYEAQGSQIGEARCLIGLGNAAQQSGNLDEAQARYEQALERTQQGGIRWGVAGCLNVLGEVARLRERFDEAEDYYRRAERAYEAIGSSVALYPATNRALMLVTMGRHAEARPLLELVLATFEAQGVKAMVGAVNVCLLPCVGAAGDWQAWDRHVGRARRLLEETGFHDADTAHMATLGGEQALHANQRQRARDAYLLALEHYRALSRVEDIERMEGLMADLDAAGAS
jgi:tetratricopeptide (TPR) repeat protein